jgi:hypothetical protein
MPQNGATHNSSTCDVASQYRIYDTFNSLRAILGLMQYRQSPIAIWNIHSSLSPLASKAQLYVSLPGEMTLRTQPLPVTMQTRHKLNSANRIVSKPKFLFIREFRRKVIHREGIPQSFP